MKRVCFFLYTLLLIPAARLPALGMGSAGDNFGMILAAYKPDGKHAAMSFKDGTIGIWDIGKGRLVKRFPAHAGGLSSLSYSPDGNHILSTGLDGFLRVWDAETALPAVSNFDSGISFLSSASYNHRGDKIVFGSPLTGQVRALDAADGTTIWDARMDAAVYSTAFSPDDSLIAVGGDYVVRLLDGETGEIIRVFEEAHNDPVIAVSFSPDGNYIASAADLSVCLWDVERGALVYQLEDIGGFAVSAAFSPDGRRIMTVADNAVRLWAADTGRLMLPLEREYVWANITSAVFSPDGKSIIVTEEDRYILIYDAETGKPADILYDEEDKYEFTRDDMERLYPDLKDCLGEDSPDEDS